MDKSKIYKVKGIKEIGVEYKSPEYGECEHKELDSNTTEITFINDWRIENDDKWLIE